MNYTSVSIFSLPKEGDYIIDINRPHLGIGIRHGNDLKCWYESMRVIKSNANPNPL